VSEIKPFRLADSAIARGYRLRLFDEIGSTNDEALQFARGGGEGGVWFVAKAQRKGRGRHARSWISPQGNLYASLLLIDALPASLAPQLGFVAGVALARALRETIDDDERLKLKWPNDVLCDGAKLAGILLEGTNLSDGRFASVIGIGVNCASAPQGLPYPATALAGIAARNFAPQDVLLRLSHEIVEALDRFAEGAGFGAIREEWLASAAGIGAPIRIETPSGCLEGRFQTIDPSGRLLIECADGTKIVEAGDVWLTEPMAVR
jgi:BirA family transcriptional regulator, biotin operon repressor / biotin---[acetyl-CoA-carboxylase] ligase